MGIKIILLEGIGMFFYILLWEWDGNGNGNAVMGMEENGNKKFIPAHL